jgi:hypothetical protein
VFSAEDRGGIEFSEPLFGILATVDLGPVELDLLR